MYTVSMAKRMNVNTKNKASRSRKTKKRLDAKHAKLAVKKTATKKRK
jgi:hypothetical protein